MAEAARAAGIDVRGEGVAAEDGDGGGGGSGGDAAMLNVQEMRRDAFWLQRRISRAMPDKEADAAQQLAESVFAALQASLHTSVHATQPVWHPELGEASGMQMHVDIACADMARRVFEPASTGLQGGVCVSIS